MATRCWRIIKASFDYFCTSFLKYLRQLTQEISDKENLGFSSCLHGQLPDEKHYRRMEYPMDKPVLSIVIPCHNESCRAGHVYRDGLAKTERPAR
jgi:hypothetical protein